MENIKEEKKKVPKKEAETLLKNLGEEMFNQLFLIEYYKDKVLDSIIDGEDSFSIKTFNLDGSYRPNQKLNAIFTCHFGKWDSEKKRWIIPMKYKESVVDFINRHSVFWEI